MRCNGARSDTNIKEERMSPRVKECLKQLKEKVDWKVKLESAMTCKDITPIIEKAERFLVA